MPMTAKILVLVRIDRGCLAVSLGEQAVRRALLRARPSGQPDEPALALSTAAAASQAGRQAGAQELIAAMESQLDGNFERLVEQCLWHLSQYAWLGQSELAAELAIEGANQIERGKAVREVLLGAIERLRPAGARPCGASCLPREWYSYAILYDAYVADVPNRNIMSRLYISEGTFNRRRREALHAVACALLEVKRSALAAAPNRPAQVRAASQSFSY